MAAMTFKPPEYRSLPFEIVRQARKDMKAGLSMKEAAHKQNLFAWQLDRCLWEWIAMPAEPERYAPDFT